ncbi:MAG: TetR family transcriptional regulator [Anaerolineales bacterium]|nr:TetR family transcriptional regulator [Anaerolineales bacterium]
MENHQHNPKQKNLTIGQVAEAVSKITNQHCTSAMIYNYERLELLETPERSPGGFRLFSLQDVSRVVKIKQLQDEGLSLSEINERLQLFNQDDFDDISWPDQPIDRRSQILEAALRIFPNKGFTDTTLQDIAQEVGISGPAIYQYFKSKEELFLSLFENLATKLIFEELTTCLQINKDASIEDIRLELIDLGEAFINITSMNIELMRMFIIEARRFQEVGEIYVYKHIAPVEEKLAEFFDYYVATDILNTTDTRLAAHAFFGMFLNIVFAQHLMRAKHYLEQPTHNLVSQMVIIFLNGLKKY